MTNVDNRIDDNITSFNRISINDNDEDVDELEENNFCMEEFQKHFY